MFEETGVGKRGRQGPDDMGPVGLRLDVRVGARGCVVLLKDFEQSRMV